jgi:hypothetical protein
MNPIIFYLDETWVMQNHSPSKTWQVCNDKGELKVSIWNGKRVIICHDKSSESGFIKGCKLIFQL